MRLSINLHEVLPVLAAASGVLSAAVPYRYPRAWPFGLAVGATTAFLLVGPQIIWQLTYTPSSFDCPADGILQGALEMACYAIVGSLHLVFLIMVFAAMIGEPRGRRKES